MSLAPLELLSAMRLEDGRRWGEVAAGFQLQDARAIFDREGPRWHFETRPRGGSKTTDVAGVGLAWLAAEAPAGARGYVVAVDGDQAGLLVDAAAGLVDRTPALRAAVEVRAMSLVARGSGASVEVLSADGASAFGLRPGLLICDEFAQWPTTRNARRLWTALLSAMGKVPGSRLVILTSAGEPNHPSYQVLQEARRSERWRVSEVPGPLPWVPAEELEAQRPLLRESEFSRLHLNVWTASEDRLVSEEDLEAACVLEGALEPAPHVSYVVSLDVGLKHDRTVAVVAHAEDVEGEDEEGVPRRRVVVDRLGRWRGSRAKPVALREVEDWIEQASGDYHGAPLHADPYQAVGSLQRLRSRGVNSHEFVFSAQSVGRVANALHLALRNRLIWLPDDEDLRLELGRVQLRESSPGVVRLDHSSGSMTTRRSRSGSPSPCCWNGRRSRSAPRCSAASRARRSTRRSTTWAAAPAAAVLAGMAARAAWGVGSSGSASCGRSRVVGCPRGWVGCWSCSGAGDGAGSANGRRT